MRSKAKLDYARRLARVGYNARDIVTITRLSPTDVIQILRSAPNADALALSGRS